VLAASNDKVAGHDMNSQIIAGKTPRLKNQGGVKSFRDNSMLFIGKEHRTDNKSCDLSHN
jgi:hypothetical protein